MQMQIQKTNKQPAFKANLSIKFLSGGNDISTKEFDILKKTAMGIGTVKDDIFAFVNHSVKKPEGKDLLYTQDTVVVSNIDNKLNSANFYRSSIIKQRSFDFIFEQLVKLKNQK